MKKRMKRFAGLVAGGSVLIAGVAGAAAQDTAVYDWPDADVPVVVSNDSGVIFLGKDKTPYRAYSWKGEKEKPAYVVDLNRDGSPEIVGAGNPTFVLATNSDPIWSLEKGCRQVIVGDFVVDKKLDLFCQNNREMKVYTNDGQFVWELSLGRNVDTCIAGDMNGDLKADLECKYRGSKQFAIIESNGTVLNAGTTDSEIGEHRVELEEFAPVGAEIVKGEQRFDLTGDGKAEERLVVDGKNLNVLSTAEDVELAQIDTRAEVVAAIVKDLDGDGTPEIVAVTKNDIFVVSADGKEVNKFSANAARYKRYPVAELASVYANGFEDDEKAKGVVEGLQDKLAQCYASRVKRHAFAGSGRVLVQLSVNDKGKVTRADQMHSDVGDKQIEKCARETLKKGKFPAASGQGSVNVNMTFTFRDK